ncbi:MAG: transporter substrate-binding domain-containing protein [Eubacterium sp.]|nr:transporter substrate-binding domain-containing protein [Eubacterium sp.]
MKKKLFGVAAAVALTAALMFTGCGGSGGSASSDDPLADGVLKIGTNATYVPLEYRDEDSNEMVGFDIDLGDALAGELGVKAEWVDTSFDGIFNGLNAKQYDAIIAGVSITPDRSENFNMSTPYISNGIVIVSRNDETPGKTAEDLRGKRVGVQIETTADIAAQSFIDKDGIDMDLQKFDGMLDAFTALEGKSLDYVVTDKPVGQFYTSLKPDVYSVTSDILSNEPIGIVMRKDDTEFAKQMEEALQTLRDNGKLAELSEKWFGEDVTQNIDTELKVIE